MTPERLAEIKARADCADVDELVAEVERLRCAIDELDDAKDTVAHYSWCSEVIKAVRTWPQGRYGMRLPR